MIRKVTFIALILMLAMSLIAATPGELYAVTVSADSVTVSPGESVAVPIRLSGNSVQLGGYQILLQFNNPSLTADSVSFVGSILPVGFNDLVFIDNSAGEITFTTIPDWSISPLPIIADMNGILATIHFSASPAAIPGATTIDSIFQTDSVIVGTTVTYANVQINLSSASGLTSIFPDFDPGKIVVQVATDITEGENGLLPDKYSLAQNYPNPFNPATTIEFTLPQAGQVDLSVYNILGQKVSTLASGRMSAGNHQIVWDASLMPSGIYFYRLVGVGTTLTKKMILSK